MMKNSRKILLIILILSICGVISLPFCFQTDQKDAINMSGYLVSTISSLVTIIIAYILFDRFGVSKKILDKNVETVCELLEVIKSKIIYAEYESDTGTHHSAILISDDLEEFKKNKIMLEKDILFNYEDINNGLSEINQFATNIWLPPQIKDKINKISLLSATSVKDNFLSKNKCVRVSFNGSVASVNFCQYLG